MSISIVPPNHQPGALVRSGRALRQIPAVVSYAVMCVADTLAVTAFMFLVTLSPSALLFTILGLAAVAVAPPPREWVERFVNRDGRLGALAVIGAVILVAAVVPATGGQVAALPFAVGAAALVRWGRGFRAGLTGHTEARWAPAAWVGGACLGSWMLTSNFLFLVLVGVAWHHRATLKALLRRERRTWAPTAVVMLGAGLLLALPRVFRPVPEECFDATRSARPQAAVDGSVVTVALLGDSSTEAVMMPGKMSYGALLERRLNAAPGERRFRVVNCGRKGAATSGLADQLDHALAYRPAIVITYIGYNDQPDSRSQELDERRARFRANLEELVMAARDRGLRPILVTPPSGKPWAFRWNTDIQQVIGEIGRAHGVEVVDAQAALRARPLPALYFVADLIHPNARGHELLAAMLAEQIHSTPPTGR